jgi:hypothetical protein
MNGFMPILSHPRKTRIEELRAAILATHNAVGPLDAASALLSYLMLSVPIGGE